MRSRGGAASLGAQCHAVPAGCADSHPAAPRPLPAPPLVWEAGGHGPWDIPLGGFYLSVCIGLVFILVAETKIKPSLGEFGGNSL